MKVKKSQSHGRSMTQFIDNSFNRTACHSIFLSIFKSSFEHDFNLGYDTQLFGFSISL